MMAAVEATHESAAKAVHAAEELVERAVVAAERSLAHRIGERGLGIVLGGLRALWVLTVIAYFLFGITLLVTRYYLLPHIGDWRTRIESMAGTALKAPVSIGLIEADWDGLQPRLLLRNVVLQDATGGNALTLPQVEVVVSWTTLVALQPRMQSLTVLAPELEVHRLADRRWSVAGIIIDPNAPSTDNSLADWVLAQNYISIRNARVHVVDSAAPAAESTPSEAPASTPATAGAEAGAKAGQPSTTGNATSAGAILPAQANTQTTADRTYELTEVDFVLSRSLTAHHMALQLRPPADLAGRIDMRAQFTQSWDQPTAHYASWSGRLYVQFDYADLARLDALTHIVPPAARLDKATGALRAWIDFSGLDINRLRADVALNDVAAQLRPDLQPLRLQVLEGRVTHSRWTDRDGDTRETALTGLHMEGPDQLRLPATDLLFRTTQPAAARGGAASTDVSPHMHFEASRIVLSDWSRLALQVPLPADWLSLIERTAARGTLDDLQADWGGPDSPARAYALKTRFSGLGFALRSTPAHAPAVDADAPGATGTAAGPAGGETAPVEPAPYACENLAGSIDLNQDSGTLRLDSARSRLLLPAVFEEPAFSFDTLAARVRWRRDADAGVSVDIDSLAAANEDLDLSVSGAYRTAGKTGGEPARLDLSGRIARGRVNSAYRYLPHVTAAPARAWIRGGLLDGTVTAGSFYLHGDPQRFPFSDPKAGDFHASLHVQDGQIDVAPRPADAVVPPPGDAHGRWPQLTGIEADVVFDRNHLTVTGRSAKAYGFDLTAITARLPDIDHPDQHVLVDGQGAGPLAELLRFLVASPVNGLTGGWLGSAEASGPARLKVKLDVPLGHSIDTIVNGTLTLRNDNIVLRKEVAPFSAVTGDLGFNQRGIRFNGLTAGYIGGEVRLSGDTLPDGTIAIQASGTTTPQGAKRQIDLALLRRVLDRTRGNFRYTGAVTVQHGKLGLQIDSDLTGLAADLPDPFRKAAAEARPLHLEIVPVAGADPARDTLRATLAGPLNVELHRVGGSGDGMRIERGAIAIGGRANVPDAGLLLFVDQPHLDVDRWTRLLGLGLAPTAAETRPGPGAAAAPGSVATSGGDAESVDMIVLHAADMAVSGKTLSNVSLSARRDPDQSWNADIDSDQASGSVHWVGTHGTVPGRITARLGKLVIPESDKKQVTELLDAPPTDFPALDIVADQLELGSAKLGRLEVEAQNSVAGAGGARADSWNLQKLSLTNPDGKLTGTGSWQREGNTPVRRMTVKFTLDFTNGGGVLGRFGVPDAIRNGKGKLDGELAWRGSPFAINYPSLTGKLHLAAEKGQFLKADAGVRGRLLGVFSLQSLPNRVTLDFRDLFSEGFAFDSITANAVVTNGNLTTDDFIMKGLNAVIRIKGDADINAETQKLEVVVIPEINAGTASLAYILVNPAIGVGTFLANYLFRKPLQAAFTNVYMVTGSWADPKVEKIKLESKPAPAPAGGPSTP